MIIHKRRKDDTGKSALHCPRNLGINICTVFSNIGEHMPRAPPLCPTGSYAYVMLVLQIPSNDYKFEQIVRGDTNTIMVL